MPTGATSFTEAMKIGTETYHTLKKVISAKYGIDGMSRSISGYYSKLTCALLSSRQRR